ncbi:MAG: hypothetical protein LQ338_001295 [Usnochroma carphineum]|nr:MAG: hypothetical protein LQ338_001295 [Usnochroma carphineum]
MPFKLFFPLPGRKASHGSPVLIETPIDSHDDSPCSDPGPKAERVLGTLEPAPSHGLSNKSSRKALRKKPTFMNINISEAESGPGSGKDGFPFPSMPSSRGSSRHPSHTQDTLRNQPSSPLLGERFFRGSPGSDSMTNSPSPRPHFYGSSSTLRSYYDPAKSPLSISQQTSASSARDMALRKGHSSIASPLSQDVSNAISPSAAEDEPRLATGHVRSRRPAHLGLAERFPKHRTSSVPILLSDQVSKSPSQLSYSSSQQSVSSERPNWWKRKKAKESKSKHAIPSPKEARLGQLDLGLDSLKTHIKKPRAGTKHWFDGGGDDSVQNTHDLQLDADEVHRRFWNKRLENLRSEQHDLNESCFDQTHTSNGGSEPEHTETEHTSQFPPSKEAPSSTSTPKSTSRSSTNTKADRSNQSFLELSSSSDEETEGDSVLQQNFRHRRIRDSIDENAIGDDVLVSSAEKVRSVKPKPVVSASPRRSKRGSEVIPPVPKIPERPQLQQRVSSMKWRESQNFKSPTITTRMIDDSTSSSAGGSIASRASSSFRHSAIDCQFKKPSTHGNTIMTVTVEEGELLEAMRQTRASIRQDAFNEGYTRAVRSTRKVHHHRPRISGTDGRISPTPSLSTTPTNGSPHQFQFPDVPPPSSSNNTNTTSNNNNNNLPSSFPPKKTTPSRHKGPPPITFPPPKASSSPTESFSPSDLLPSTPRSSGLSPLTPSFFSTTEQEDDLLHTFCDGGGGGGEDDGGGKTRGGVAVAVAGRKGHLRKRTVSSGVIMLDGMEERGKIWEGEGERW